VFQDPSIDIYSQDAVRLAAFYERLGFRETYRTPSEGVPTHVEVTLDRFTIGISSVDVAISDHGWNPNLNGRSIGIVLWTDDTDRDYARLTAEGAPLLSAPHTFRPNQNELRTAWIADPDGNPITLVQVVSRGGRSRRPESQSKSFPLDVVMAYINALDGQDYDAAMKQLHDDVRIRGPAGETFGKPNDFIEMLKKYRGKYDIKRTFADGDDVCLLYDLKTNGPTVFMTSWYQVRQGKIASIHTVFDPRAFGPPPGKSSN